MRPRRAARCVEPKGLKQDAALGPIPAGGAPVNSLIRSEERIVDWLRARLEDPLLRPAYGSGPRPKTIAAAVLLGEAGDAVVIGNQRTLKADGRGN